jgi:Zn-finger protein
MIELLHTDVLKLYSGYSKSRQSVHTHTNEFDCTLCLCPMYFGVLNFASHSYVNRLSSPCSCHDGIQGKHRYRSAHF